MIKTAGPINLAAVVEIDVNLCQWCESSPELKLDDYNLQSLSNCLDLTEGLAVQYNLACGWQPGAYLPIVVGFANRSINTSRPWTRSKLI